MKTSFNKEDKERSVVIALRKELLKDTVDKATGTFSVLMKIIKRNEF
jgi:hypothetical protein